MSLIVKIHRKNQKTIIAVCDSSLLGKKIEDNANVLDLSCEFYNGEECDERIIGDLIRNADGVNLVGINAIKLGIQEGVIEKEQVKKVKDIPYAQAILIQE